MAAEPASPRWRSSQAARAPGLGVRRPGAGCSGPRCPLWTREGCGGAFSPRRDPRTMEVTVEGAVRGSPLHLRGAHRSGRSAHARGPRGLAFPGRPTLVPRSGPGPAPLEPVPEAQRRSPAGGRPTPCLCPSARACEASRCPAAVTGAALNVSCEFTRWTRFGQAAQQIRVDRGAPGPRLAAVTGFRCPRVLPVPVTGHLTAAVRGWGAVHGATVPHDRVLVRQLVSALRPCLGRAVSVLAESSVPCGSSMQICTFSLTP